MQSGSFSGVLIRAAEIGVCPLCVVVQEFEGQYLKRLRAELVPRGKFAADLVAARGLCLDHSLKLEQALATDDDAVRDALGLYVEVLDALIADLSRLEQDGWLDLAHCPLCLSRDHETTVAAQALTTELDRTDDGAEAFLRAGGLCLGHFMLTWVSSEEAADRDQLRDLQLSATNDLTTQIRTTLPDESRRPRDQQSVADLCKRAAHTVSGWTATPR